MGHGKCRVSPLAPFLQFTFATLYEKLASKYIRQLENYTITGSESAHAIIT